VKRILRWLVKAILLGVIVSFTLLLAWAFESRTMPALRIWHTVRLSAEFTAGDATPGSTLQDYLDREARLFQELKEKVYDRVAHTKEMTYCRYYAGGLQDPEGHGRNWNRTFELVPEKIKGGALLLHGLTDSPYSLRRIGEILHAEGFYVLGLRLPAHGTVPGALTKVRWEDWVAASRIGARHVRNRIGAAPPLVMAGYSNGGALAVKYALDALSDPGLPRPDRLLLFSPEIGITPFASISNMDRLLSFLPFFQKFKWLSIEPEYDPYKYNSFPKNAGQQAHDITAALQDQVDDMHETPGFADFPPVLTFLSWVDSTVETSATIHRFYNKLKNAGSELVVFDINRFDKLAPFLPSADADPLKRLQARSDLPYRLTVITNGSPDSEVVRQQTQAPRTPLVDSTPLSMFWPPGVYSLAHVAIPFPPDDPVYGGQTNVKARYHGLPLGRLHPRGETGLLTVSVGQLMRLRHNPFFPYMEERVVEEVDSLLDRKP
jgi:alpha-beta hydrolase superfamily lysophospholipase